MKKIISLVLVLMLCVALAAPAMAADVAPAAVFTDSPVPVIEIVEVDKFILSTLLEAEECTTEIPQETRDMLIEV